MSDLKKIEDNNDKSIQINEQGYVNLPFSESQLKDFIVGLLGKPQRISKTFFGVFKINKNNILNIHELIHQRLHQQNGGQLLRLNCTITYRDNSTIILRSLEEFITYNEIKPVVATGITLNWQYLIKFNDKEVPERQSIELVINTNENTAVLDENLDSTKWQDSGYFHLNIMHTARTWGSDIENLLTNHINKVVRPLPKLSSWFKKKKNLLSKLSKYGIILIGLISQFKFMSKSTDRIKIGRNGQINEFFASEEPKDLNRLSEEIEFLSRLNFPEESQGVFDDLKWWFAVMLITFMIGYIVEYFIEKSSLDKYPSFLLLTGESEDDMIKELKKQKFQKLRVFGSIFIGVISSLIASYLFLKLT